MKKAPLIIGLVLLISGVFLIPTSKLIRGVQITEFQVLARTNDDEAFVEVYLNSGKEYKAIISYTYKGGDSSPKLKIFDRDENLVNEFDVAESGSLITFTMEHHGIYKFKIEFPDWGYFGGYSLEIGEDTQKIKIEQPFDNLFFLGVYNIILGLIATIYGIICK